jgi:hypothetical protein
VAFWVGLGEFFELGTPVAIPLGWTRLVADILRRGIDKTDAFIVNRSGDQAMKKINLLLIALFTMSTLFFSTSAFAQTSYQVDPVQWSPNKAAQEC